VSLPLGARLPRRPATPSLLRSRSPRRAGFVLLAVLWVLLGVATLALGCALAGREAAAAAHNRVAIARAAWAAEGCLERARAAIGGALSQGRRDAGMSGSAWDTLDRVVASSLSYPVPGVGPCDVRLHASGVTFDVNVAGDEQLRALFTALGLNEATADSLADALLDWRDADDLSRPLGAERAWYERQGRHPPRNGPLADVRELPRVRGFDALLRSAPGLDSLFAVESGPVVLGQAPLAVIASLPGVTEEALGRIAERRALGQATSDLLAIAAELSPASRAALEERYRELMGMIAPGPGSWTVTSRASAGPPPVSATIEVRLVRAGARAAVVRRRTWP